MNTKEYLKQAYRINEIVESDISQLKKLRELSISIASGNTKILSNSGTKNPDKIGRIIAKIIDLEDEINNEVDELVSVRNNIYRAICKLTDADEQLLLRLRYLELYSWEQIIATMNYSERQIFRIHGDALNNLKLIKDGSKCH